VARTGIQALLAAAELAEGRGHDQLQDIDIKDAYERARRRIRESNLRSLTLHHHVLYELIRREGELSAGDLHDQYERVADDVYRGTDRLPVGKRSRRNKLDKLREYDLVDWDGESQHRRYWPISADLESSFGKSDIIQDRIG